MATAVDRVSRSSSPAAIEADLSALWRDIGERGPIARAMMSNLIVFQQTRAGTREIPIHAVAAQHPCRAIVIDHEETPAAERSISADVEILTFGPPRARYGVEQIWMRAACPAQSLPSLVRRLVRGDLPTSVWWAGDVSRVALVTPIVTVSRQLVYDSRNWHDVPRGVRALAPFVTDRESATRPSDRRMTESPLVDLADVNWRRLLPIRRALIVAAESSASAAGWPPDSIRITHRPGDSALAWLLAGWLASRLKWPDAAHPRIEEARHDEVVLSVVVGEGPGETRATLDCNRVVVTRAGDPPSVVGVRQEGEADAIAAELNALAHDACLHDALSALLRTFRAA